MEGEKLWSLSWVSFLSLVSAQGGWGWGFVILNSGDWNFYDLEAILCSSRSSPAF